MMSNVKKLAFVTAGAASVRLDKPNGRKLTLDQCLEQGLTQEQARSCKEIAQKITEKLKEQLQQQVPGTDGVPMPPPPPPPAPGMIPPPPPLESGMITNDNVAPSVSEQNQIEDLDYDPFAEQNAVQGDMTELEQMAARQKAKNDAKGGKYDPVNRTDISANPKLTDQLRAVLAKRRRDLNKREFDGAKGQTARAETPEQKKERETREAAEKKKADEEKRVKQVELWQGKLAKAKKALSEHADKVKAQFEQIKQGAEGPAVEKKLLKGLQAKKRAELNIETANNKLQKMEEKRKAEEEKEQGQQENRKRNENALQVLKEQKRLQRLRDGASESSEIGDTWSDEDK